MGHCEKWNVKKRNGAIVMSQQLKSVLDAGLKLMIFLVLLGIVFWVSNLKVQSMSPVSNQGIKQLEMRDRFIYWESCPDAKNSKLNVLEKFKERVERGKTLSLGLAEQWSRAMDQCQVEAIEKSKK